MQELDNTATGLNNNIIDGQLLTVTRYSVDGNTGANAFVMLEPDVDNQNTLGPQIVSYPMEYEQFDRIAQQVNETAINLPVYVDITTHEIMGGQRTAKVVASRVDLLPEEVSDLQLKLNELQQLPVPPRQRGKNSLFGVVVMLSRYKNEQDSSQGGSIWVLVPNDPNNKNLIGCQLYQLRDTGVYELFAQQAANISEGQYQLPCLMELNYKHVMAGGGKPKLKVTAMTPIIPVPTIEQPTEQTQSPDNNQELLGRRGKRNEHANFEQNGVTDNA